MNAFFEYRVPLHSDRWRRKKFGLSTRTSPHPYSTEFRVVWPPWYGNYQNSNCLSVTGDGWLTIPSVGGGVLPYHSTTPRREVPCSPLRKHGFHFKNESFGTPGERNLTGFFLPSGGYFRIEGIALAGERERELATITLFDLASFWLIIITGLFMYWDTRFTYFNWLLTRMEDAWLAVMDKLWRTVPNS